MNKKFVYLFREGNAKMRNLLGGKGANLAQMTKLKMPVPQGFIITTEACNNYYDKGKTLSDGIKDQILTALSKIEKMTGKKLGDFNNPLLLSVRSGARESMPGMMDSVLNLGMNDKVCESMAILTNDRKFALDSYRRFIQIYADVVMNIPMKYFEQIISATKKEYNVVTDNELNEDALSDIIKKYKVLVKDKTRMEFPQGVYNQLFGAIEAVFQSWNNDRAIFYRKINEIPARWGTAVNVQAMVFGNMGEFSGSGVAFTRNPATGEHKPYGEYLMNAQGEDIVSGVRTPITIDHLKEQNPAIYKEFLDINKRLELFYKDMQEIEFTIENGKFYILQTRNGKRTAQASLKIAIDMVREKLLTKKEALLKIDCKNLDSLLHPNFNQEYLATLTPIAQGLPASPGAASGVIALSADKVNYYNKCNRPCILVKAETSPEDIEGMSLSKGVLTATGGMTSHAAVVARGMGITCVSGCSAVTVDEAKKLIIVDGKKYKEGEWISVDGATGNVYGQEIHTEEIEIAGDFATIMKWCDQFTQMQVRANADTETDTIRSIKLGANGVGLCRTEHMFFQEDRIRAIREMIIAETKEDRITASKKLLPFQKSDFIKMFKACNGLPLTIRYLDPPLHEFLPKEIEDIKELAEVMNRPLKDIKRIASSLKEFNPMMGFRGCRLSIVMPEIAIVQTKAVIEAAIEVFTKYHIQVKPEIMIPLIGDVKEFLYIKDLIDSTAKEIMIKKRTNIKYTVGTMIEVPRAVLKAGEIAKVADFFSFGTNDLTQMVLGFSRDDAGKFLHEYEEKHIIKYDPFQRIDEDGVGLMVQSAIKKAKAIKPNFKFGICGEHGGDPTSIKFFHKIGLTYVSCSPFRVPIAKLACAQAEILNSRKK